MISPPESHVVIWQTGCYQSYDLQFSSRIILSKSFPGTDVKLVGLSGFDFEPDLKIAVTCADFHISGIFRSSINFSNMHFRGDNRAFFTFL